MQNYQKPGFYGQILKKLMQNSIQRYTFFQKIEFILEWCQNIWNFFRNMFWSSTLIRLFVTEVETDVFYYYFNKTEHAVHSNAAGNSNIHCKPKQLQCNCNATAMQLRCNCDATAMQLRCNCNETAMQLQCN